MLTKTIIIYSSVDGQTKKICHYIKDILTQHNHLVDLFCINDFNKNIADYSTIIIASSIRYGKHNEQIEKLIQENYELLNTKKAVFISVNLVARKIEKRQADTNPYVVKFLNAIKWKPTLVAVFPGRLNYSFYGFGDRIMIKLIMLITKGPTNSKTDIEYTDWNEVKEFANKIMKL